MPSFLSFFLAARRPTPPFLNRSVPCKYTFNPPFGRDPPALPVMDLRSTAAARLNFSIYYEVDGDTSKHSLQSSTYGRDKEWVLLAPAP